MTGLVLSAMSLVTCLGHGADAALAALRARRDGLLPCDFAGLANVDFAGPASGHIGPVAGVEDHALPPALAEFECRNNRLADMALHCDGFAIAVADAAARLGAHRIAVVVGTSTSGVLASEEAYRTRDPLTGALPERFDYNRTLDLQSLAWFVRTALRLKGPALTISTACASSARAFIDAAQLIAAGVVDAAIVGGADSLCRMTLRGFAALELISPEPCRPCDAARQGISVGEAAGFCLLERGSDGIALLGAGCSTDGYHMSAPRPDGSTAALAMQRALASARLAPGDIDYVNLHGTGTQLNDAAEDQAVAEVFGDRVKCSSTKGYTGHTMGSCGIVEAVLAAQCLRHGLLPGGLRVERVDPAFRADVAVANEDRALRRVMSNSFGFGGVNVSLVLGLAG
jgi:3-oxoacyl-[acyl-carrier-protein] synthase I